MDDPIDDPARERLRSKFTACSGTLFLTGSEALIRLAIVQRMRDRASGHETAGFISGYRGSPLGGFDQALWKAEELLAENNIRFQPGINEDLAATAVWGTQQLHLLGEATVSGVFALWYAKGPGVDRSADVLKHMNHAGTAPLGGVLLVAGDDHGATSSTLPHQSDQLFQSAQIPILYPSSVADYIELGLHGWAMSRYCGCAIGFKALADTVESSAVVDADPFAFQTKLPDEDRRPRGGLNAALSSAPLGVTARNQEALLLDHKLPAVLAYARANRLDRMLIASPAARIGIVASGKSLGDVEEALATLGIIEGTVNHGRIRLYKVSMPWPLEPGGMTEFAEGLDDILVVEEKQGIVEDQMRRIFYDHPAGSRPRIHGKIRLDARAGATAGNAPGTGFFSPKVDFTVGQIARAIAKMLSPNGEDSGLAASAARIDAQERLVAEAATMPARSAHYCAGCPHSRSTKVPDGSFALGGIGCHIMATAIDPDANRTFTQMGGEGATWIGQAPFSKTSHVFANLGDGTYFHSGLLAIRAAIAARVNITYKILFNDAVAMTGGQSVEGGLTVPAIARQLSAEGVGKIAIVSEDPSRYRGGALPKAIASIHPREALEDVQREFRRVRGTSVIIYDQVCAAEKRRRLRSSPGPAPTRHLFINPLVCEGCGDCAIQSNCSAVIPVETEFGRKRAIDQSACNLDTACLDGFCPSFVTIEGGTKRKRRAPASTALMDETEPPPSVPMTRIGPSPFNLLICGIGGTGVVTLAALLGDAAHREGKAVSVLDMTGMAQKNGAVISHVRIAERRDLIHAQRIPAGTADVILGCDMLTAAAPDALARIRSGHTRIVLDTAETPPGQAIRKTDWRFPAKEIRGLLEETAGASVEPIDATSLARDHLGSALFANLLMLGYAAQRGLLPLDDRSIRSAIAERGIAVEANQRAFRLGRRLALAADDAGKTGAGADPLSDETHHGHLQAVKDHRTAFLTDYQNEAYARKFRDFVARVEDAERGALGTSEIALAVAQNLFKLMAYKDEYEVARLLTGKAFEAALSETFEGDYRVSYHLAPPLLSALFANDPRRKWRFGTGARFLFRLLTRLKGLRHTRFDPFAWTDARRQERALIAEYRDAIETALPVLDAATAPLIGQLAFTPEMIRGYGPIKTANVERARARQMQLLRDIKARSEANRSKPTAPLLQACHQNRANEPSIVANQLSATWTVAPISVPPPGAKGNETESLESPRTVRTVTGARSNR